MNRLKKLKQVPYRLCLTLEYGNVLHEPHKYETDKQLKCHADCKLCKGTGLISGDIYHAVNLAEKTVIVSYDIKSYTKVYCCYCMKLFHPLLTEFKKNDDDCPLCPHCGMDTLLIETPEGKISRRILKRMKEVLFLVRTSNKKK